MFEDITFNPGRVVYNPYILSPNNFTDIESLNEDMFQVEYINGTVLDIGWYGTKEDGSFIIFVIKNRDWEKPLYKIKCKSVEELYIGLIELIEHKDFLQVIT